MEREKLLIFHVKLIYTINYCDIGGDLKLLIINVRSRE